MIAAFSEAFIYLLPCRSSALIPLKRAAKKVNVQRLFAVIWLLTRASVKWDTISKVKNWQNDLRVRWLDTWESFSNKLHLSRAIEGARNLRRYNALERTISMGLCSHMGHKLFTVRLSGIIVAVPGCWPESRGFDPCRGGSILGGGGMLEARVLCYVSARYRTVEIFIPFHNNTAGQDFGT